MMFNTILERNNDLSNFFWPLIYYTKSHLLLDQALPLWNIYKLSGTPLLPDSQSFLFYPPHILFLFLPIDIGFIILIISHLFIGTLGIFLICRQVFNFTKTASIFASFLFVLSPKMAGFLEAGHIGLIYAYSFLPILFLSILKLLDRPNVKWVLIFAIASSLTFYSHPITFLISLALSLVAYFYLGIYHKKITPNKLNYLFLGLFFTFGLITISLLPQIEWSPQTNRFLLLLSRDTYPKWISIREFFQFTIFPWNDPIKFFWSSNSEKIIYIGIVPTLLAFLGFLRLKKNLKITIAITLTITLLISLNNISPIYSFLVKQDFFALLRVSTRIWFVILFIIILLSSLELDFIIRTKKYKKIGLILIFVCLLEFTISSYLRLLKPIIPTTSLPEELITFLKSDKDLGRVFCVNFCISEKQAVLNSLELVEGYNTLISKNYYQQSWQLTGKYWNYYSLSIPPVGIYSLEKITPDAKSLGEYNVKYIISPYSLSSEDLILKSSGNYSIYENKLFKPRAYFLDGASGIFTQAPLIVYQPNFIKIDTNKKPSGQLYLSVVYNQGWRAYLNGGQLVPVQQRPNALILIDIKSDTRFVDFKYEPESFRIGRAITLITISLIGGFILRKLIGKFSCVN